jgi:Zn-dependent peptidase ImmA (M78 family)/DNA-binding XRE family transcriptional regulator
MNSQLNFNPQRLRFARARRMMTIKALAEAVDMTSRMISNYENGNNDVPVDTLDKISAALCYPKEFFYGDQIEELDAEWVSFRSMKGMRAAQRDSALSAGGIAIIFSDWIEKQFSLPDTSLFDLREFEPETAASALRAKWGLGEKAVSNMIHLLESKGVRVFSLAENNKEVDAFSFWKNDKAYVFLNTFKSAERSRFDAAHELGHLVMHKHGGPVGRDAEAEADRFASAFLMPEKSVRASAPKFASIENLIKLKKLWLVSLAALVRRLKDLSLISEWHYRTLTIEMSKRGMLRVEPEGIQRESSQILSKVFYALRANGMSKNQIARELLIPEQEIDNLAFGLAFVGTTIESANNLKSRSLQNSQAKLTLVKN